MNGDAPPDSDKVMMGRILLGMWSEMFGKPEKHGPSMSNEQRHLVLELYESLASYRVHTLSEGMALMLNFFDYDRLTDLDMLPR